MTNLTQNMTIRGVVSCFLFAGGLICAMFSVMPLRPWHLGIGVVAAVIGLWMADSYPANPPSPPRMG